MDVLKTEIECFEQHRQEWCKHHLDKIVVIHGTTIHGFYDTYETALEVGYEKCGVDQAFLLKKVAFEDEVIFMPSPIRVIVGEGKWLRCIDP